ncbi:hypothetical protein FOZ63_030584 [Perkinsus olseni]|uniref:RRM domain-containing protein n=2 Tax=Perkinsus olseni TaxID=32597 RepID=A0A7J6QZ49_PEROL|nr:hypothetical protein FOZ63_030584 [Perkinsus olseni]
MQNLPLQYSHDCPTPGVNVEYVRAVLAQAAENAQLKVPSGVKDNLMGDTGGSCAEKDAPYVNDWTGTLRTASTASSSSAISSNGLAPHAADTPGVPALDDATAEDQHRAVQELTSQIVNFLNAAGGAAAESYSPEGNDSTDFPAGLAAASSSSSHYCVLVYVDGMSFTYQLLEHDLRKVFGMYGNVEGVEICPGGESAVVRFFTWDDAATAVRTLHNKVLNGVRGRLCVEWYYPPSQRQVWLSEDSALKTEFVAGRLAADPAVSYRGPFGQHAFSSEFNGAREIPSGPPPPPPPPTAPPGDPSHTKATTDGQPIRKYTCRFEIGIENDRDFHVARRIIGTKGVNMKRIVKMSDAKLRLRGRGSGFLEGNMKRESDEPLHLCISCVDPVGYRRASREVEKLLKGIYEEYRSYCEDYGLDYPENLTVVMREHPLLANSGSNAALNGVRDAAVATGQPFEGGWDGSEGWHGGEFYPRGYFRVREEADCEWPPNMPSIGEIEKLIDERNEARRMCNFKEADRIRDLLRANGIGLMDEPGGRGKGSEVTTWRLWRQ